MPVPPEGGAGTSPVFQQLSQYCYMAAPREGVGVSRHGSDGVRVGRHEQARQQCHISVLGHSRSAKRCDGSHEHTCAACNLVALGQGRYASMYARTTTRGHWDMADAQTGESCHHVVALGPGRCGNRSTWYVTWYAHYST